MAPPQSRQTGWPQALPSRSQSRDVDAADDVFECAAAALPERGLAEAFAGHVGLECRGRAPEVFELGDTGRDERGAGEDAAQANAAVFGHDFEQGVQVVVWLMGPRPTAVDRAANEPVSAYLGDFHGHILVDGQGIFTSVMYHADTASSTILEAT
ncbi:MAG: hypothetical protein R3C10_02245 [Pirellulales bacterium]